MENRESLTLHRMCSLLPPIACPIANNFARKFFETALQSFTGVKYYKGERARTFFKQAEFLALIGNSTGAAEVRQKSESTLLELRPLLARDRVRPFTLGDYYEAVMIMSR